MTDELRDMILRTIDDEPEITHNDDGTTASYLVYAVFGIEYRDDPAYHTKRNIINRELKRLREAGDIYIDSWGPHGEAYYKRAV